MQGDEWDKPEIDSAVAYTKLYFRYAADNKKNDLELLRKDFNDIKNRDWAFYINAPANEKDFKWWRNNNYDPERELQSLSCPVLSLFGEKDNLVPPKENARLSYFRRY
ncbi:MAG: hypothetical protein WB779_01670 [Ignavibacteriaceae bacterium]